MTTTSPRPADPLFAAEAELHLSLEHPDDLLIGVTVRLDMDTAPMLHHTTIPWLPERMRRLIFFAELLVG